jgi:hypothetical protein
MRLEHDVNQKVKKWVDEGLKEIDRIRPRKNVKQGPRPVGHRLVE